MQKLLIGISAAALAMAAVACQSEANAEGWYGKVSIGQAEAEVGGVEFDEGLTYGAALGTSIGWLRVEAGVDRVNADLDAGFVTIDGDALIYSATAYLDLPVGDNASVYVGAGLDYVDGEANALGTSIDANGDGWHYAVGGAYRFSDRIIGEVQLTQIEADLDADWIGAVDLSGPRVTLGLRLEL